MKQISFDKDEARWDAWQRPHVYLSGCNSKFVLFDTGEIVLAHSYINATDRFHYSNLNITIANSDEVADNIGRSNKLQTIDGTKVAKAHIMKDVNGGVNQQLFLIDHDVHEVYLIYGSGIGRIKNRLPSVPKPMEHVPIYWSAHNNRPVSHPVRLVYPRKLDRTMRERKAETELLCEATSALKGRETRKSSSKNHSDFCDKVYETDIPILDLVSSASDYIIHSVATHGVPNKKVQYVPYLRF